MCLRLSQGWVFTPPIFRREGTGDSEHRIATLSQTQTSPTPSLPCELLLLSLGILGGQPVSSLFSQRSDLEQTLDLDPRWSYHQVRSGSHSDPKGSQEVTPHP